MTEITPEICFFCSHARQLHSAESRASSCCRCAGFAYIEDEGAFYALFRVVGGVSTRIGFFRPSKQNAKPPSAGTATRAEPWHYAAKKLCGPSHHTETQGCWASNRAATRTASAGAIWP